MLFRPESSIWKYECESRVYCRTCLVVFTVYKCIWWHVARYSPTCIPLFTMFWNIHTTLRFVFSLYKEIVYTVQCLVSCSLQHAERKSKTLLSLVIRYIILNYVNIISNVPTSLFFWVWMIVDTCKKHITMVSYKLKHDRAQEFILWILS